MILLNIFYSIIIIDNMLNQYKCQIIDHRDQQIQGSCENIKCSQQNRKVCVDCIKFLHSKDQNFQMSDIKSERDLQNIIDEFKDNNADRLNNIILQCQIQQYLINIQLIEQVKLWNYKYDQLNHIIDEFDKFHNNEWNQLTIKRYLENQILSNGIDDYLLKIQDKLLLLDDKKDAYIHNTLLKDNYEDYRGKYQYLKIVDKFSEEFILRLSSFNQENNNSIKESIILVQLDELFQSQQFIDHQSGLYESLFKEGKYLLNSGYKLKTDAIHKKFLQIQDKLLENMEEDKKLYIQSNKLFLKSGLAISLKHSPQDFEIQQGLQYIKNAINLNPEQQRYYLIQSKLFNLSDQPENALNCIKQVTEHDKQWECLHEKAISYTKQKMFNIASQNFDQVIKKNSKHIDAYFQKANIYYGELKDYKQAIKIYDQCIYRDPKHFDSYFQKGTYYSTIQLKYYKNIYCNSERPLIIMINAQKLILVILNHISKKVLICFIIAQILQNSLQNYEEAVQVYSQCIYLNSNHFESNYFKGNQCRYEIAKILYHNLQKFNEASEVYDKCISLNGDHFHSLYSKASILYHKLNQYEEALQYYDTCIMIDSIHFDSIFCKAQILFLQMNQFPQAIKAYDDCIKINPNHFMSRFQKAQILYMKLDQYNDAIVIYDKCIQLDPNHFESNYSKGIDYYEIIIAQILSDKLLQFENAIRVYDKCIKINPNNYDSYLSKALILTNELEKYQDSIKVFEQYIKLFPKHLDSHFQIGKIFQMKYSEYKEALKQYDKCIEIDPQHFYSHYQKAKIFLNNLLDYQESIKEFDLCIEIDSQHFDSHFQKANLLHNQFKKYEEALQEYDKCIELYPTHFDSHYKKALLLYENLYRYQDAINVFDQCIKLSPTHFDSHFIKAQIYSLKLQKYSEALQAYEKCILLKPNHFDSNYSKALILSQKLLKYNESVQAFKDCLRIDPTHFECNYQLGQIISQFKQHSQFQINQIWIKSQLHIMINASKSIRNTFNLIFIKVLIKFTLAKILSLKLKQFQDAINVYDQCIRLEPNYFDHYFQKASILSENLRKYDEALLVYKQFKKLFPQQFDSYQEIGIINVQKGLIYELKLQKYSLAIKTEQNSLYFSFQKRFNFKIQHLAQIISENQRKYADGVKAYDECIKLDPTNFDSYFNKAKILSEKLQEYQKALWIYDKCIELEPNNYLVYQMKGITLQKWGSFVEARFSFEQVLQLSPQNDVVLQLLVQVQSQIRQQRN
ncbi:hypothetical protein pb186bvf_004766 [Paramecium bursaria]